MLRPTTQPNSPAERERETHTERRGPVSDIRSQDITLPAEGGGAGGEEGKGVVTAQRGVWLAVCSLACGAVQNGSALAATA